MGGWINGLTGRCAPHIVYQRQSVPDCGVNVSLCMCVLGTVGLGKERRWGPTKSRCQIRSEARRHYFDSGWVASVLPLNSAVSADKTLLYISHNTNKVKSSFIKQCLGVFLFYILLLTLLLLILLLLQFYYCCCTTTSCTRAQTMLWYCWYIDHFSLIQIDQCNTCTGW